MKKILLIDDSDFYSCCISNILIAAGYRVIRAVNGQDGLSKVITEKPDLILLDVVLPDVNGLEICRALRASEGNSLLPIIILTAQDRQDDKLAGLELGADDYIIKPFNHRELLSRVSNTLLRIDRNRRANPLTGLKGNLEIRHEISSRIERHEPFAAIYLDLDHFKAYNDVYGFARGDSVIKLTAEIIEKTVGRLGHSDDFVGHIGGDDFIVITQPDCADEICQSVIRQFDRRICDFYTLEDLKRGCIQTLSRDNKIREFPIMSISLAVITSQNTCCVGPDQVAEAAAELKKWAKSIPGSNYVKDRRVEKS